MPKTATRGPRPLRYTCPPGAALNHIQCAALPYAVEEGQSRVLLITSRAKRRWIIPKGWARSGVTAHQRAAHEALAEAGLVGTINHEPFGLYRYKHALTPTRSVSCLVLVYLFRVERELDDWPEKGLRLRRWLSPSQAAYLVKDSQLVEILLRFGVLSSRQPVGRTWPVVIELERPDFHPPI
ncbi:MAG: NUDIX hydrolase [Azospirillaceae bacterium]|nr:NUDIX hydrolase [Azospirillaceae bacterium]